MIRNDLWKVSWSPWLIPFLKLYSKKWGKILENKIKTKNVVDSSKMIKNIHIYAVENYLSTRYTGCPVSARIGYRQ